MTEHSVTGGPMASAAGDRRRFLLGAGTLGIAAAGAAVAGSSLAASPSAAPTLDAATAGDAGPMMIVVRDAARGQLAILVGDREVLVTDPATVSTVLAAAGR